MSDSIRYLFIAGLIVCIVVFLYALYITNFTYPYNYELEWSDRKYHWRWHEAKTIYAINLIWSAIGIHFFGSWILRWED